MTQRPAFGILATLPIFLALGCADPGGAGPAGGSGGSGGAPGGSGGTMGSGGAPGSGGSDGSGGAASGGSDGGGVPEVAPAEVAPEVGGDTGPTLPDPGKDGDGRFMMNRPATPPEANARLPGVMAGTMQTLQIPAAGGVAGRSIQVYTPAGYQAGTPIAFTVFHDGAQGNGTLKGPVIMDNLAFQKKMPAMVGIFIPPVARSVEYDTVNDRYTQWITTTVLPAVEARNIKLTKDPEATGTCGHSSGGILAFTMAWFHPERYRRVLSLSGSYLNLQNPGGGLYDNLVRTTMPLKPIRVSMIAGTNDLNAPAWTNANEKMGAALLAAGYHTRYFLINGGTHNPAENVSSLPDLLTYLWRGYPATGPTF